MKLTNKKIAIIGAGPVGLTMAALLQQKGIDVTVYERDEDAQARIWGGTLDLHEGSGQEGFKKAGLLQSYFDMAIPMGRTLADEQSNVFFTTKPQFDSPEINRNDLRKIILDRLTNGSVVWDSKLIGMQAQDGACLLQFENKPDATADLVMGANGGMSKIRKYVTDAQVEYTGTYIIQGEVDRPESNCPAFFRLCADSIFMTAADGITFVANPKNKGALTYNVTFTKPEQWVNENGLNFEDTDHIARFLSDMVAEWNPRYKQLFLSTTSFVGLPSRKISLENPWKNDRILPITLIGDAAHLMPPFAGQGVNTGLKDALILSDNLTSGKFETLTAAISDYEHQMFVYAKEAQGETSKNEIEMHRPGFSFKKRFSRESPDLI